MTFFGLICCGIQLDDCKVREWKRAVNLTKFSNGESPSSSNGCTVRIQSTPCSRNTYHVFTDSNLLACPRYVHGAKMLIYIWRPLEIHSRVRSKVSKRLYPPNLNTMPLDGRARCWKIITSGYLEHTNHWVLLERLLLFLATIPDLC